MDPTRNSVSQLTARLAAMSASPIPPHQRTSPFATSDTPAPGTCSLSITSFIACCNSGSVFGCGNSVFCCATPGAEMNSIDATASHETTTVNLTLRMRRSLERLFHPRAALYPRIRSVQKKSKKLPVSLQYSKRLTLRSEERRVGKEC